MGVDSISDATLKLKILDPILYIKWKSVKEMHFAITKRSKLYWGTNQGDGRV